MKRFLVVNPFGIGDALFSLVLVESLRKAIPDAYIGFVCNERTRDVVAMDASVDRTYVFHRDLLRRLWRKNPLMGLKKLRLLVGAVREERFDAMFDLSLGTEYAFFARMAGIRERIGLDYRRRGLFLTKRLRLDGYSGRHVVDFQLDLLEAAGIPARRGDARLPLHVSGEAAAEAERLLKKAGYGPGDKVVAVAPGGGKSWGGDARYKQWDAEAFGEAAAAYAAIRRAGVVFIGDRSEAPLLAAAAAKAGGRAASACGLRLEAVAALLRRSQALLCNDGGLLHLANALGVKTVSIFGPVDETVYGPYGEGAAHEVLTQAVECRPCYRDFRFPGCAFERRCLTGVEPRRAAEALAKIA